MVPLWRRLTSGSVKAVDAEVVGAAGDFSSCGGHSDEPADL